VVVDCAAVSPNLVEAELFGHERGAYTSADRARPGAFELAAKGTLFLDEVGELPLELQPKLLRVLERREVKRLGAAQITDVDVRVVAATHRDLFAMVGDGTFREDLYYRLAEVVIAIPPLRERRQDVEPITAELIRVESTGTGAAFELTPDAATALAERDWPGNVRELRNTLRRAMALSSGPRLTAADFALGRSAERPEIPGTPPGSEAVDIVDEWWSLPLREAREAWGRKLDRAYLVRLMDRCSGDEERAASESGIHLKSLQRLLRQHGLRGA
jgi:transcriptional regulator with GAF, ATPase, and Fis domain